MQPNVRFGPMILILILFSLAVYLLSGCSYNYAGCRVYNGGPQPASPVTVSDSSYTLYSPATATQTHTWSVTADPTISKAPSGALSLPGFGQTPPQTTTNVPAMPGTPPSSAPVYIPPPQPRIVAPCEMTPDGYPVNKTEGEK